MSAKQIKLIGFFDEPQVEWICPVYADVTNIDKNLVVFNHPGTDYWLLSAHDTARDAAHTHVRLGRAVKEVL